MRSSIRSSGHEVFVRRRQPRAKESMNLLAGVDLGSVRVDHLRAEGRRERLNRRRRAGRGQKSCCCQGEPHVEQPSVFPRSG